jgi:protein-S-isoprenylcysteine O-methyltransferase Ste14
MIAAGLVILWLAWVVVWVGMARGVKSVAVVLLAAPRLPLFPLDVRFVPAELWPAGLGLALTFAGLAFALWARLRLAGNWSSGVTLKSDHELIADGPSYRRRPLSLGPPPNLHRPAPGALRHGAGDRRMARAPRRRHRGCRLVAQAAA